MRIHERLYMSATSGRTYIVVGDDGLVMIDACDPNGARAAVEEFTARDELDLTRLRALLLTHLHCDHTAGAAYLRATFGVPVVCHPLDAEPIVRHEEIATAADFLHLPTPTCTIDYALEDGDEIVVGSLRFHVVHLPGHSRGGVGYQWEDHLFIGDTMFSNGGIGWSDAHWGSNLADHADSIRAIAALKPRLLCCGHGDPAEWRPEVTDEGIANVRRLMHVGLAPTTTPRAPRRSESEARRTIVVDGIPPVPALAPDLAHDLPRPGTADGVLRRDLRTARLCEVRTGNLRGAIRPMGELHGLILAGERDVPITRPFRATMNLEHYCEEGRYGKFVPRLAVAQAYEVEPRDVIVHFAPHPEWAVTSTLRYTVRDDAAFDILFSFVFGRSYRRFEAFIASYFAGERIPYVAAGGKCVRPTIKRGAQLFFPRDSDARRQVDDGRWGFLKAGGTLFAEADPHDYDAPITIHRDDETGWAFVQMVDRRECAAVSANTFAWAQDFSLVGRDVAAGERIDVRARVVYRKLDAPEDALALYRAFQDEIDAG